MNARTHIAGGLVAAGVALSFGFTAHPWTLVLASGFGGLVPDWDHPYSTLGRYVPWPAISRSRGPYVPPDLGRRGWPHPIWHRHQAHSLVGLLLASSVCLALTAAVFYGFFWFVRTHWTALLPLITAGHFLGGWILAGFLIGGISHLILDGFNMTRQWWLWPFSHHGFRWPLHASVRATDSWAFLLLVGVGLILIWHLGYSGLFPPVTSRIFP